MAALLVALALAAPQLRATLVAPTHLPRVNAKWYYRVRVTDLRGRPLPARITVQIVDPFRTVHPVQFGTSTRNVTNWRIKGTFRDFVQFPPESRGFKLTFRVIVRTAKGTRTLAYWVKSR